MWSLRYESNALLVFLPPPVEPSQRYIPLRGSPHRNSPHTLNSNGMREVLGGFYTACVYSEALVLHPLQRNMYLEWRTRKIL
jgi:hypothetical protein